ncbi:hypothetical protein B0J14DRAFT_592104 [Halenospora varia]|nr:hypothetical protein B0J14DRAFT_592104 [Halenospora varia]
MCKFMKKKGRLIANSNFQQQAQCITILVAITAPRAAALIMTDALASTAQLYLHLGVPNLLLIHLPNLQNVTRLKKDHRRRIQMLEETTKGKEEISQLHELMELGGTIDIFGFKVNPVSLGATGAVILVLFLILMVMQLVLEEIFLCIREFQTST